MFGGSGDERCVLVLVRVGLVVELAVYGVGVC